MPASTSARVVVAFSAASLLRRAILALTSCSASSLQALLSTVSGFQRERSGYAASIACLCVLPATRSRQYVSWRGFASGSSASKRHLQSIAPRREKRGAAPKDGSPLPHAAEDDRMVMFLDVPP